MVLVRSIHGHFDLVEWSFVPVWLPDFAITVSDVNGVGGKRGDGKCRIHFCVARQSLSESDASASFEINLQYCSDSN